MCVLAYRLKGKTMTKIFLLTPTKGKARNVRNASKHKYYLFTVLQFSIYLLSDQLYTNTAYTMIVMIVVFDRAESRSMYFVIASWTK